MKNWYQSKTLWFNAIVAGLVAIEGSTGVLQPYLPANFYSIITFALPVVNAALRIVTTQGIILSGQQK